MKWLESTLKQFIPAAIIFAILFLLLRIYEFELLRNVVGDEAHIARIEIGAIGHDAVFALMLISIVLIIHLLMSIGFKGIAYITSAVIFTLLLMFDFGVIQYFASTLTPLSADLFGYSPQEIYTTVLSSGGVRWTTVTPFVVVMPVLIALLIKLKRRNFLERIPFKFILPCTGFILLAWFLPYAPSPESYEDEMDYYLATNKMHYFIAHTIDYAYDRTSINDTNEEYPLLHTIEYKDNLGQFFNKPSSPPNLVIIIVEGLGRDFTGPGAAYGGFTPFLDSISRQSLYWENFLSNAGRTFGALPSILGSLPYSREGFMSQGTKMPDHQTLISLLKPYGYSSSFFYGGNPNFDKQDIFLEYQGFDKMIDQTKFTASFKALNHVDKVSSWGYPDQAVFRLATRELKDVPSPRVDVYLTLSTHEPFDVPDKSFESVFDEKLQQVNWPESRRRMAAERRNIFSCLLYTDNAIKSLIHSYASRADYDNTIFIITGDHRLVPIPLGNKIDRFHVPLIIYSPLLKQPKTFSAMAIHSEITPSVLGLLKTQFGFQFPTEMPFISGPLSVDTTFTSDLDIALIQNKNGTDQYIDGEYFLSNDQLFKVLPGLGLKPLNDQNILDRLKGKLRDFKTKTIYACENNRLDKVTQVKARNVLTTTAAERSMAQTLGLEYLTADQQYEKAQQLAFSQDFRASRAILKPLLNESPNFHDARILLARTYAWSAQYDTAILYLNQTINRAPAYADAYCALADIEYWRGRNEESLTILDQALSQNTFDQSLLTRKARALMLLGRKEDAGAIVDEILKKTPDQELALKLKQQLNTQ